ncbi:MAG: clostripain-related cysteine peptidase [candidate division WOR-3 bacterium]
MRILLGTGGWGILLCFLSAAMAAQWTVGVYMCADNGMSDLAYLDIAELQRVGSTSEVNIVVQVDNAARDSNPSCRRYYVGKDRRTLLADLGEQNMADTATLISFCYFLKERYPAENYMLILWDHGNGWYPGEVRTRSIFVDESHQAQVMDVAGQLGRALERAKDKFGRRITVLAMDACLMQMIEVAAEVRASCDYLLASEGLVPLTGLPYDEITGLLVARPTSTPAEFLPEMCRRYVQAYPATSVCLSAVDLRQLDRVLPVLAVTLADSIVASDPCVYHARLGAQTFGPSLQYPPSPSDDHVDLLGFWALMPATGTVALRQVLNPLVKANAAQAGYEAARGIAIWFPDRYLEYKYWQSSYSYLGFCEVVNWLGFLNNYYATDDVKPAQPQILCHRPSRNGFRLYWSQGWDVAPVAYELFEAQSVREAFSDYCQDFGNWTAIGWRLETVPGKTHSPPRSFFSGSGSGMDNQLVLVPSLCLPAGGLLSFYASYATEERQDSLGIHRDVCLVEWSSDRLHWQALDSLYGTSLTWHERRYLLPASNSLWLRFRYRTNATVNDPGVWIDDLKVHTFGYLRQVVPVQTDTSCQVFNPSRDTSGYEYFVRAVDSFGNYSLVSQYYRIRVSCYAEPYTRPAPFSGSCELVLDFPHGMRPDVRVYTISGTLVRQWQSVEENVLEWDGCNQHGRELADGLYVVAVEGRGFRRIGKICRVSSRLQP